MVDEDAWIMQPVNTTGGGTSVLIRHPSPHLVVRPLVKAHWLLATTCLLPVQVLDYSVKCHNRKESLSSVFTGSLNSNDVGVGQWWLPFQYQLSWVLHHLLPPVVSSSSGVLSVSTTWRLSKQRLLQPKSKRLRRQSRSGIVRV